MLPETMKVRDRARTEQETYSERSKLIGAAVAL
jgi:hypothetical protein